MVKTELVEGLKMAIAKGESLESAMSSFYNAGYTKDEIEEAAMAMQFPSTSPELSSDDLRRLYEKTAQKPQGLPPPLQKPVATAMPKQLPTGLPPPPKVIQQVSNYDIKPSRSGTTITIILVALLLILLGVLAAVILFKDQLSNLLNNLFWFGLF